MAGYGAYECSDGKHCVVMTLGPAVFKSVMEVLGLPYGTDEIPAGSARLYHNTPGGKMIDEAMAKFCAERPASEVERIFSGAKVPASLVYSYTDMKDNPHFQARETFTTYPSARYETDVIAPNVQPVLKNEPGLVWRSGVDSGFDNEDILRDFGFDESQIEALRADGVIGYREDSCPQLTHR